MEENLDSYLVTEKSKKLWNKHLDLLNKKDKENEEFISKLPHDTVGAICLDSFRNISSGVSSGGHSLCFPGRVGEAAGYNSIL
jgi:isoaspartyl peptidase/L-asparaginase-like protein (Ntn-hydrolase superfamily)